jgi:lipopolysaccharide transport system ATP-binding protein
MSTVISAEHVSKTYRLGAIGGVSLNEDVARWWARLRGRPDPLAKVGSQPRHSGGIFRALNDVSFQVPEGEILGVIGRNGAGKSTLLKILSQVTAPTSGRIRIRGRVASLLEVGTGFHPDLTGRENIFLNGAIMGMTKAEIRRKFDDIVEFSECAEFIDTPVKRYSSGMYVRLAFAVAAHLEPEILIVDEVLAVGDAKFQKKCLGKMGEVTRGGRTVLFVSHNMVAVQSLCRRAVMLRDGQVVADDLAAPVVSQYLRDASHHDEEATWASPSKAPGVEALRIKQIRIEAGERREDGLIGMENAVQVKTEFWVMQAGVQTHLTYHLVTEEGVVVLTTSNRPSRRAPGLYEYAFTVPGNLLNSGRYSLKLLIVQDENRAVYIQDGIAGFGVVDTAQRQLACLGREPSILQMSLPWKESALDDMRDAAAS